MKSDFSISAATHFDHEPNKEVAGLGLAYLPLIDRELADIHGSEWTMAPAEQLALIYLLEKLRPQVAIELGTQFGGSLQVLAKLCGKVYSLDIDPQVPVRLKGRHANVEYIIGSSHDTLPVLIKKLAGEQAPVSFILIDGDHRTDPVRQDINNVMEMKPLVPLFILLHDSFNPGCRKGIATADWARNPYVHAVELDFVTGSIFPLHYDMWGGFALAVLLPEKRTGKLEISGRGNRTIRELMRVYYSSQVRDRFRNGIGYRWRKLMGGR